MRQTGAYLFLLFIFIGSTNITINQHLCNGELESTAFFIEAQPCEHASEKNDLPPCHKKANSKKCCSTNQITIQGVDWFHFSSTDAVIFNYPVDQIISFTNEKLSAFLFDKKEDFSLKKIPIPPLIKEDVFLWNERFLI